jgi:hypothetical protein
MTRPINTPNWGHKFSIKKSHYHLKKTRIDQTRKRKLGEFFQSRHTCLLHDVSRVAYHVPSYNISSFNQYQRIMILHSHYHMSHIIYFFPFLLHSYTNTKYIISCANFFSIFLHFTSVNKKRSCVKHIAFLSQRCRIRT